jgi:hypothetical protein
MKIENFQTDLGDGLLLINLVEILTNKPIEKYTKAPKTIIQKIQNVNMALKAISDAGVMKSNTSAEGTPSCISTHCTRHF